MKVKLLHLSMHMILPLSSHTNRMGQQRFVYHCMHSVTKGRMSCMEEQQIGNGTAWHQSIVLQPVCMLSDLWRHGNTSHVTKLLVRRTTHRNNCQWHSIFFISITILYLPQSWTIRPPKFASDCPELSISNNICLHLQAAEYEHQVQRNCWPLG